MARHDALPSNLPPRGLCREVAAQYVGLSPSKFDEAVANGTAPKPKTGGPFGTRKVWDRLALDRMMFDGPDSTPSDRNEWDDVK